MVRLLKAVTATIALLASGAVAHPGVDESFEIAQRAAYLKAEKRTVKQCAEHFKRRGHEARAIARRQSKVADLRKKRSLSGGSFLRVRDIDDVLSKSHHSDLDVTPDSDHDVIFAGNASCLLSPDVTEGPYWVSGELVRENVVEEEPGVELVLDVQLIDTSTCEPLSATYLEIWHCNSTGVYSGVVAGGNGNGDESNLDNTALRGIQQSGDDGVVGFTTIVPGHYVGRTQHIHVMSHTNAVLQDNGTISGGTVSHVGQLFFDQDLLTEDFIMAQSAEDDYDPVVEYVLLGDSVADGLFGWITIGVNPKATLDPNAAATLTENGGVANPNGGGFPGGQPPSS